MQMRRPVMRSVASPFRLHIIKYHHADTGAYTQHKVHAAHWLSLCTLHTWVSPLTHSSSAIRNGALWCQYINEDRWGPPKISSGYSCHQKNLRKVLAGCSWKPADSWLTQTGEREASAPPQNKIEGQNNNLHPNKNAWQLPPRWFLWC